MKKNIKKILCLLLICSFTTIAFALPKAVDNSVSPFFPPRKSLTGWCAPFALIYYQFSYEYSRRTEIPTVFSPHLTYDINPAGAVNAYKCILFMIETGSPVMGTDEPLYKLKNVEYIKINNNDNVPTMIQGAKEALAEGHSLSMGCFMGSHSKQKIKNNPASTEDDSEVYKYITYWRNGSEGQHWITCIGYNDDLWTDVNKNNVIDTGELGAFLFISTTTKFWIAYDAFYWDSPIEGAPTREDGRWTVMGSSSFYKLVLFEEFQEPEPEPEPEPIGGCSLY